MKVWIVKYALTNGVYQVDAEACFDISPHMIAVRRDGSFDVCFHRGEWFESRSDAIDAAEDHLRALCRKGAITIDAGKSRGIVL